MKRLVIHTTLACFFALIILECSDSANPGHEEAIPASLPADSARLSEYRQRIDQSLYADPVNALRYCHAMVGLADSLDDAEGRLYATIQSAWAHFLLGHPDSADQMADRALNEGKVLKNDSLLGGASYIKGVILSNASETRMANARFRESYAWYESARDSLGMATARNGIGISYYGMGKYDSAVHNYLQAMNIAEKMGFEEVLGKVYVNLGVVFDLLDKPEEAKSSYAKSIGVNTRLNRFLFVSQAYNNTGNILKREHKLDSARAMYVKALEISSSVNNLSSSGDAYSGLAGIEEQLGNYSGAHEYYNKASDYYARSGNREGMLITFKNLAANEEKRGNYKIAQAAYDSSLKIAQEKGLLEREKEIRWSMYDNFRKQGNYLPAMDNLITYFELKDSLAGLQKQERIVELEMKYEQEKYKSENLMLRNDNLEKDLAMEHWRRQRNTTLTTSIAVIVIILLLSLYFTRISRKNRIIAEQRIQQLEEEKKLLAARSIVEGQEEERKRIAKELHDGLGVILSTAKMHFTSIRDKSPETVPLIEKATELLDRASVDVRRISHNMMPGLLTKLGLYEAVEDLLEEVDEMEGIEAETLIEGESRRLPENREIMLFRIIQELVNNTLKHAGASHVRLKIKNLPDHMMIEYSDDGEGFDPDSVDRNKSLGLQSIQSRIEFMGGKLQLKSAPGAGVDYAIEIPLQ